jgi:hypothetical protein
VIDNLHKYGKTILFPDSSTLVLINPTEAIHTINAIIRNMKFDLKLLRKWPIRIKCILEFVSDFLEIFAGMFMKYTFELNEVKVRSSRALQTCDVIERFIPSHHRALKKWNRNAAWTDLCGPSSKFHRNFSIETLLSYVASFVLR